MLKKNFVSPNHNHHITILFLVPFCVCILSLKSIDKQESRTLECIFIQQFFPIDVEDEILAEKLRLHAAVGTDGRSFYKLQEK